MYCKKCGKFIGNDSDLCDECLAKEGDVFAEFPDNKVDNAPECIQEFNQTSTCSCTNEVSLCKPITAIVLSAVGFWFIYIGIMLLGELESFDSTISAIVFGVLGLVPSVIGLIFGVKSIRHFKATSKIGGGKRIPLLILGIVSVVLASLSIFLVLLLVLVFALL